jgi:hypothetical protein
MMLILWLLLAAETHTPEYHLVLRNVEVAVQEGGDKKEGDTVPHALMAVVVRSKGTDVPTQELVSLVDVHKNLMMIRAPKDAAILLHLSLLNEEPIL